MTCDAGENTVGSVDASTAGIGLSPLSRPSATEGLFDSAKKKTIIQLRWPLVILCSYLFAYSPQNWLDTNQTQGIIIFYLLTNAALYFIHDKRFGSPYFYGPILLFDTLFLVVSLALSGLGSADFYLVCFLTVALSCICDDSQGLLIVTFLAPLIYGYYIFNTSGPHDSAVYLRILFPFVISVFYGYFAQVERLKRKVNARERDARERQETAERVQQETERHLQRIEALREIDKAINSTLDLKSVLNLLLGKIDAFIPFSAATTIRLLNQTSGKFENIACCNIDETLWKTQVGRGSGNLSREILKTKAPVFVRDIQLDTQRNAAEFYRQHGFVSYLGVPLIVKDEVVGILGFYTKNPHEFNAEEINLLLILAGQAAIAIHNSQLYEQITKQAAELTRANKVKDQFLSIVSHELRTPLNLVMGYAATVREGIFGDINQEQQKALEKVLTHSKDLLSMITNIIHATRIEANEIRVAPHVFALADFLTELKSIYDSRGVYQLEVIWDYPHELPILETDREKLKQVMQNLIQNAIKFTESGEVRVSARLKEYLGGEDQTTKSRREKFIEFQVADTGVGIPEETMPVVFEMFRQADSSETRPHGGMGLGLYTAKRFTELLGGTIDVETAVGKGSTFTVRIPCTFSPSMTSQVSEGKQSKPLAIQEGIQVFSSTTNLQLDAIEER